MRRFLVAVICAITAALCGAPAAVGALPAAPTTLVSCDHDAHQLAQTLEIPGERGPPGQSSLMTTYDAVGHCSLGASADARSAATPRTYHYDDPAVLTQAASSVALAEWSGRATSGAFHVLIRGGVAANAGRAVEGSLSPSLQAGDRSFIYGDRVLTRAKEGGDSYHNFPSSFDSEVLTRGARNEISEGYVQYTLRGSVNGVGGGLRDRRAAVGARGRRGHHASILQAGRLTCCAGSTPLNTECLSLAPPRHRSFDALTSGPAMDFRLRRGSN